MGAVNFTAGQRQAIETVDRSVLVSAAAGSGKTAVLAERCAHLICDAPAPYGCRVDQLLVVTFTEAAAAEMKERIAHVLRERSAAAPQDGRLRAQLALVDAAQISTLHAFCLWIVRRWFDRVGVDAAAQLLDGDEARLLAQDALVATFNELYGDKGAVGGRFRALVDDYGLGYDGGIKDFVDHLARFVTSLDEPQAWLAKARDMSPERVREIVDQTRAALVDELGRQIAHTRETAAGIFRRLPAGKHYGQLIGQYAEQLEAWQRRLESGTDWEDVRVQIAAYELSAMGARRMTRDAPDEDRRQRDAANDLFKEVREKLLKKRVQQQLCRRSADEIAADLEKVAPYQRTLIDITERFMANYARRKRQLGVMDFSDLERFTFDLLKSDPGVRAALHRRFAHVLVDEYQDINPLQAQIIAAVSREGGADGGVGGNLFTVGDVKQSIYRFRLAEPDMFVRRAEDLRAGRGGVCIDLQYNFRSQRRIIDAVNAVFRPLMRAEFGGIAYDTHAELRPPLQDVPRGPAVELHVLERDVESAGDGEDEETRYVDPADPAQWDAVSREGYLIGRRIQELMQAGTPVGDGDQRRPLRPGDICVLLRSTRHSAAPLANMLRLQGIPVFTDAGPGLFDAREVREVLALLSVLDNLQQDIPLAAVLRSGILGESFTEDELAEMRVHDRDCPFHEVVRLFAERGAETNIREKLGRTLRSIARYRREARERPLADVLWAIYRDTGYLALVGGWRRGEQRRANLVALHERARQFGAFRRQGLRRFLRFIESLQAEGDELAGPTGLGEVDDAVRIVSIHRAKGLQFPVVIAAELGRQFNLSDTTGRFLYDRRVGVGIKAVDRDRLIEYPTALHRWCARSALNESLAEELRVWYVALTRAKERLILVGSEHGRSLARLRAQSAGSAGTIGSLRVLAARSPLHWLIAAQGTMPADAVVWNSDSAVGAHVLFQCRDYAAATVSSWTLPDEAPEETKPLRDAVAGLAMLPPDVPLSAESVAAERLVDRLGFVYPHLALSSIPVARAASAARRWARTGEVEEPAASMVAEFAGQSRESRDAAIARGQAVHKALQFLEMSAATDAAALARELDRLVAAGQLTAPEAACVDVAELSWFFTTELGQRVRAAGAAYRREWMFLSTEPPEILDPTVSGEESDRVLIRGVVDGVLVQPDALEIIDFKTDCVTGAAVERRAAEYGVQIGLYARAAGAIWRRPVTATHLVFLHARRVFSRQEPQP